MGSSRPDGAQSERAEGIEDMTIYQMVVLGLTVGAVAVETLRKFVWRLSFSQMKQVGQAVRQARREGIRQVRQQGPEVDKPIFASHQTTQERWTAQQAAFDAKLLQAVEGALNQIAQKPLGNFGQRQPQPKDIIEGEFYLLEDLNDGYG